MSQKRRGTTHKGKHAALPDGAYDPASSPRLAERVGERGLSVRFCGEDGRTATYDIGALPLPGWHEPLAAAWAKRIGPDGSVRTETTARNLFTSLTAFVRFLAERPVPPMSPQDLKRSDVVAFYNSLALRRRYSWHPVRDVRGVLAQPPLSDLVSVEVSDYLRTRNKGPRCFGPNGYSDAEYQRILRAARSDVAAIRDRITAGRELVRRWNDDRESLSAAQAPLSKTLSKISASGLVPIDQKLDAAQLKESRAHLASNLFITVKDVKPMMALFVALTGLNVESLKEIPTEHRVIEGLAVEVQFVKRRGPGKRWNRSATWEIGPAGRELHTPGGLYLLFLDLMRPSRQFAESDGFWAVWRNGLWRNGSKSGEAVKSEHKNPFADSLHTDLLPPHLWENAHGLMADSEDDDPPELLVVNMSRIRKTGEIRRTKEQGGHLPSAAKTNSVQVLFHSYLRGDAVVRDWADEVLTEALASAEVTALKAHQRVLERNGGSLTVVQTDSSEDHQTAWASCKEPDHHPETEKPCRASFLDCFHCGNCLITPAHLPRLMALFTTLVERRRLLGEVEWWTRYGAVWVALKDDVFPRFTPAQIDAARTEMPHDSLLDLVELPWERT